MSEVGDDVRERSPLHELGEREWPVEGGRDRFRIRVRRNLSSKGPTVGWSCLFFFQVPDLFLRTGYTYLTFKGGGGRVKCTLLALSLL